MHTPVIIVLHWFFTDCTVNCSTLSDSFIEFNAFKDNINSYLDSIRRKILRLLSVNLKTLLRVNEGGDVALPIPPSLIDTTG